ncbi:SDR family oxidoreductase [Kitasatospora sp. NPDC051914]|uniref:SDR family oxidoreductase n=1 Tax=Kitasatospora sp. NPDC051914 TaxID=3154945 RepID=UPI00343E1FAE
MRFTDKALLITGGTAGIGLRTAERALAEGARAVVVTGRDAGRGAEAVRRLGDRAHYLPQDVTDEHRWEEVLKEAEAVGGPLDVLVNNAGHAGTEERQDPEHMSLAEWRRLTASNLDSVFLGCRAAIRAMRGRGGAIVNLSSTAGLAGTPAFAAYGAAKAAVAHLTRSVALYCARSGYPIRCNSVHPALVGTDLRDRILDHFHPDRETALAGYLARVPLGTLGTTDDVAAAVLYLASDDAAYVTGTQLVVGGGLGS